MSIPLHFYGGPVEAGNIVYRLFICNEGDDFCFTVEWYDFGRDDKLSACLSIYQDTWHALPELAPLFALLAEVSGKRVQPEELRQMLVARGYKEEEQV